MNGALGFIPSPEDFDSWPSGWNYRDLIRSYRQILTGLSVTSTPSSDGLLYAQGAADAYELLAEKQLGLKKVGLNANPAGRTNTYSVTEVTAKDGQRMDPCKVISQYIQLYCTECNSFQYSMTHSIHVHSFYLMIPYY